MPRLALLLALAGVWTPADAFAQSHVEVFGGIDVATLAPAGTFTTDYATALAAGTTTGGRAGQTLALDVARRPGFEGGVNWLPVPHAGVQIFVGRVSAPVSGVNSPYDVRLDYVASPPPNYVPRPFTYERTTTWPDTTGAMTVWRAGVNAIARVSGRRANLTIAGGLLLSRLGGLFEPVGFSQFRLGGHSVLFGDEARVRMTFDGAWHAGVDVGADLAVHAGRHVAIVFGVRA